MNASVRMFIILQVMALRRPILHKVLDYEDEFFALLMLVLETHSMRTTGNLSAFLTFVRSAYFPMCFHMYEGNRKWHWSLLEEDGGGL